MDDSKAHVAKLIGTPPISTPSIQNGLQDALFGGPGFGGGGGSQLSQVATLFNNNRWYLASNMRQLLSEMYTEHGLVQVIVDVPVDDGMRGGVEIRSQQLSPEDVATLQIELEREGILGIVGQGLKWTRLFGGGGILIITEQEWESPLDVESINEDSSLEFRAVDLWELSFDKQFTDGYESDLTAREAEYFTYYGRKIHASRVLTMRGTEAPSFVRPRLRGWGLSVVETLVRSLNQYLKANDLTFEVLDEFKVDVFKIKGLTGSLMSAEGTNAIRRRVQIANKEKNFNHAITMDMDDDYVQKELSFAGLAETMEQIRMQIAADMRMPITKVFGTSVSSGFQTDQNDMENYNSMVESTVRQAAKFDILTIIELKCKQLFGVVPDDLAIEFKPLRLLSAVDEENVKEKKFNRLFQMMSQGAITLQEFREACNKDKLTPIELDTSMTKLEPRGDTTDEDSEAEDGAADETEED